MARYVYDGMIEAGTKALKEGRHESYNDESTALCIFFDMLEARPPWVERVKARFLIGLDLLLFRIGLRK